MNASNKSNLFLVLDGNALLHRAWHAIPPLMTKEGLVVNAVYGFINILEKLLEQQKPTHVAVAWDLPGGTFRHEAEVTYKAQRTEKEPELYAQIPMIQEILTAYGIPSISVPGFEADDVIGTISAHCTKRKEKCLIVTGDHDTMQLINDYVNVLTFVKGVSQTKTYQAADVKERFGVTPAQMIDYKILVGDSSDNIKGFPGIGPKTAGILLEKYKSVDGIVEAEKDGLLEKKYEKHFANVQNQVDALRNLVTIKLDLKDVPDEPSMYIPQTNAATLHTLFTQYEFKTLAQKYAQGTLMMSSSARPSEKASTLFEEVDSITKLISKENLFYGFLWNETCVVSDGSRFARVSEGEMTKLIATEGMLVTHDAKGLLHVLGAKEIKSTFFDLILGAYLIDSNTRDYGLGALAEMYNQRALEDSIESQLGTIIKIHTLFLERIKLDELTRICELEHAVLPTLYFMEARGIKVDTKRFGELSEFTQKEIAKLETQIHTLAGREFNIQSPSQLAVILFEDLGLPTKGIKKTKSGYSTRASELEKLWDTHSIIQLISEYRELAKLKSTYIDVFPQLVDKDDRVHTTYNQTGTVTGRLSSTDPNLQNIPIRTELGNMIREAFIAQDGYSLVSIDYSQIELRLAADLSNDEEFITAFNNGADIHTFTASRVLGKKESEVTPEDRRSAKAINFGILYGMGVRSLSRGTGFSQTEATQFIARYFEIHKGIAKYIIDTKAYAHANGYVKTAWGRRRYLPEISSGIQMLVAQAERMAINTPLQGTKADVVKQAMIDVDVWIKERGFNIRPLLQVHDELVFEIPKDEIAELVPQIQKVMESVWVGRVKLTVNCKVGTNWGNMSAL